MMDDTQSLISQYGISDELAAILCSIITTTSCHSEGRLSEVKTKYRPTLASKFCSEICIGPIHISLWRLGHVLTALGSLPRNATAFETIEECFWQYEAFSAARLGKFLLSSPTAIGVELSLGKQLQARWQHYSFSISYGDIALMAAYCEILLQETPHVFGEPLEQAITDASEAGIKALVGTLEKSLRGYLELHRNSRVARRSAKDIQTWYQRSCGHNGTAIDKLAVFNDDFIVTFWQHHAERKKDNPYVMFNTTTDHIVAYVNTLFESSAMRLRAQSYANEEGDEELDVWPGQGETSVEEEYSFEQLNEEEADEAYAWLQANALPANELEKADNLGYVQANDYYESQETASLTALEDPLDKGIALLNSKHMHARLVQLFGFGGFYLAAPLLALRVGCFGQHQKSISQALRKSLPDLASYIRCDNVMPYKSFVSVLEEDLEKLAKTRQALLHVLLENHQAVALSDWLQVLNFSTRKSLLEGLVEEQPVIEKWLKGEIAEPQALTQWLSKAINRLCLAHKSLNEQRQRYKKAFAQTNRAGFKQWPTADLLPHYESAFEAVGELHSWLQRYLNQLHGGGIDLDASFKADQAVFKTMFSKLYDIKLSGENNEH